MRVIWFSARKRAKRQFFLSSRAGSECKALSKDSFFSQKKCPIDREKIAYNTGIWRSCEPRNFRHPMKISEVRAIWESDCKERTAKCLLNDELQANERSDCFFAHQEQEASTKCNHLLSFFTQNVFY